MTKPSKIVCVGQNYRAHTAEMGGEVSAEPLLFGKFATTVIGAPVPISDLGDRSRLPVVRRLNGEVLQYGNTRDLIFDVPFLVAFASNVFTLEPGDLILTGTPDGVGWARDPKVSLQPGDVVEVEVEGIGVLSNPVVSDRLS